MPEYIKIVKKTINIGKKLKVKVFSDDPILIPLFPQLIGETSESIKSLYAGCGAGDSAAYVDASGNVFPCAYVPIKAGNIKTSSLLKIVKYSRVFNLLRNSREKLKGKCGSCQYKYACGGCRAIALRLCNDLLAEDPRCIVK
ncbi:MAG: SPASM domain-containing protein [Candidatus Aenigmatarchaeota archaeon]